MSKKGKLLERLKSKPKDFTYNEVKTLLESLGFYEDNKGRTSGSRVTFINYDKKIEIKIHKPHPKNILKPYQIEIILEELNKLEEMQ